MIRVFLIGISLFLIHAQTEAKSLKNGAPKKNTIQSKIMKLSDEKTAKKLAPIFAQVISKYKISEDLLIGLVHTESSFKEKAVSSSGDIGLGQINPKVWTAEFRRLKIEFNPKRLKEPKYNLEKTALILKIMKNRYPKDPLWYARYHSSTIEFKNKYARNIFNKYKTLKKVASN